MADDWATLSIGQIAEVIGGGTPSTKDPSNFDGDIPWLTPKDLSSSHERYIERGSRNISEQGLASSSARLLPAGAVLLSSRAPIGYVAIAKNPISTNQGFRSLVVRDEHNPEFIYYWLKANVEELERHASGSTFKEISGSALKAIQIRLPAARSEQTAIASVLGLLDDKIELNRRMAQGLEEMARALFKSWFVDFDPVRAKAEGRDPGLPKQLADLFPDRLVPSDLGDIPEGWGVRPLGELCGTQYGYTTSSTESRVGPHLLRVTDINKRNWIDWSEVPFCEADESVRVKYGLKVGDILVARMADPGKSAIVEEDVDAIFASYLVRLKAANLADSYFIYGFLKSDIYAEYAAAARSGSVQANMNARVIVGIDLVVPPSEVRSAFLDHVLPIRRRLSACTREVETLRRARDALLPKLVSGELRLPDPEGLLARLEAVA